MTVTTLRTVADDLSANAARVLRALAEQAERGEITSVTLLVESPGNKYRIERSRTVNRLETMGMLVECLLSQSAEVRGDAG